MKMIDRNSSLRVLSELELAQVCGGSDEEGEEIVVTGTRLKADNSFSWADFGGGAGWGPTSYAGFAGIGGGGGGGPTLEYDWTALSDSDDDGIINEDDDTPFGEEIVVTSQYSIEEIRAAKTWADAMMPVIGLYGAIGLAAAPELTAPGQVAIGGTAGILETQTNVVRNALIDLYLNNTDNPLNTPYWHFVPSL